jgi:hypothetical protein
MNPETGEVMEAEVVEKPAPKAEPEGEESLI